jgi:methionyl-tRNA formyltransferase
VRVALFGSPAFALPTLEALLERHEVALVVAQPDKRAGRGHKLTPPPVAQRARELGLRLEQPERLKGNAAFLELVRGLKLDVAVTAAYGKILPQALLELPQHGFLNVHASLLPKYRGAAPVQWALIDGETETGISIMQTEAGLDTGPVRLRRHLPIAPDDTAVTLFARLAELGAAALTEALAALEAGTLPSEPQDDAQATHAPMLHKDDGRVRWEASAAAIYNRYRGVFAWPGSWTRYRNGVLKIREMAPVTSSLPAQPAPTAPARPSGAAPGTILELGAEGVTVAAGEGAVLLRAVQPAGKAAMAARAWANGYGVRVGERFGSPTEALVEGVGGARG